MQDFTVDKIQKNTITFTKWFFVFALLLVVAWVAYFLFKNSGYNDYAAALSHINRLSGTDKTDTTTNFFGNWDGINSSGGILAGSWKYGILVWEESGLKYFSVDQNTRLLAIYGCTKTNLQKYYYGNTNIQHAFTSKVFSSISDWRTLIKPGDYVALILTSENKLSSVSAYPEFKTTVNPWVFCNVILPEQSPAK